MLIGAVAALVVVLVIAVLLLRGRLGSVSIELPGMKADLEAIKTEVGQINRAVNHQPDGASTLVQRVQTIERETRQHRRWEAEAMQLIGNQLGIEIPPPPEPTDQEAA